MIKDRQGLDAALARLDAAAAERADFRERIAFYKAVVTYLFERRSAVGAEPREIGVEEARLRLAEGFPLMDLLRLDPDIGAAAETFNGLLDIAAGATGLDEETIGRLRRRGADPGSLSGLLGDFLRDAGSGERSAAPVGDEENLSFLLHVTLRPLFERHAQAYGGFEGLEAWDRGVCPICGGLPALETFAGEEGKRVLHCHRCGHAWGFRRVRCPFCDNTDHEKLRHMRFDPLPAYRVDVCDACRCYIKGVDTRHTQEEPIPEVEDLLTPHLDLLATREGFRRKSANSLGLWR